MLTSSTYIQTGFSIADRCAQKMGVVVLSSAVVALLKVNILATQVLRPRSRGPATCLPPRRVMEPKKMRSHAWVLRPWSKGPTTCLPPRRMMEPKKMSSRQPPIVA